MQQVKYYSNSGFTELFITDNYKIEFDFESMSKVMRTLKKLDAKIILNDFDGQNQIIFQIKSKLETQLKELLSNDYNIQLTKLTTDNESK